MEHACQYHPTAAGTYHCHSCHLITCDSCVDDASFNPVPRCFQCNQQLESIGPGNIEPFWRRLPQSFRYPMSLQSMVFIIVLSVLCAIAHYLPFAWLIYLGLLGTGFKYSLSCLSHTADGYMTPPDVTEAYEGGLRKMLVLIAMLFITGLITNLANHFLGAAIGGLIALMITVSFPAIIINYAITDSMLESLNPIRILNLINAIGLPYGLIMGFIMIMIGSMTVLYEVVLWIPSGFDSILLFSVTFYYLIVLHHLLGYMVFQYQNALGYSARIQGQSNKARNDKTIAMSKISTLMRSAQFNQATDLYDQQVRAYDNDMLLNSQYFELLMATGNEQKLATFLPKYFQYLHQNGRDDLISRNHKRLLLKNRDFSLEDPAIKLLVAQASFEYNNPQVTIKLLHGIHKKHPNFEDLIPALELLAHAFDEFPKYVNHGEACKKMISRIKHQQGTNINTGA